MTRDEAVSRDERDRWFNHERDELDARIERACGPVCGYVTAGPQVDPSTFPQANRVTVERMTASQVAHVRHALGVRKQRLGYFMVEHNGRLERLNPVAVEWVIRHRGARRKAA